MITIGTFIILASLVCNGATLLYILNPKVREWVKEQLNTEE